MLFCKNSLILRLCFTKQHTSYTAALILGSVVSCRLKCWMLFSQLRSNFIQTPQALRYGATHLRSKLLGFSEIIRAAARTASSTRRNTRFFQNLVFRRSRVPACAPATSSPISGWGKGKGRGPSSTRNRGIKRGISVVKKHPKDQNRAISENRNRCKSECSKSNNPSFHQII